MLLPLLLLIFPSSDLQTTTYKNKVNSCTEGIPPNSFDPCYFHTNNKHLLSPFLFMRNGSVYPEPLANASPPSECPSASDLQMETPQGRGGDRKKIKKVLRGQQHDEEQKVKEGGRDGQKKCPNIAAEERDGAKAHVEMKHVGLCEGGSESAMPTGSGKQIVSGCSCRSTSC